MAPTRVILMSCGSYNPPTNMHLRMFEIARDHLHRMGTHIVVGGVISPVHDAYAKKELASATHRCAMLRLALQHSDWIRLSTWETRQNCWTKTRLSLQHHQNLLNSILSNSNDIKYHLQMEDIEWIPENVKNSSDNSPVQIKLLCGADLLESFGICGLWLEEDIHAIVGEHGLVVITREGFNPNKFIYDSDILSKYMYNICIVTEWIPNEVSSTRIRRALKRSESVKYLLQDTVIDYIYKHEIYDAKTPDTTIKLELPSPNANNYLHIDPQYLTAFLTPSPSDVTMDSPSPVEIATSIDVPDAVVLCKNLQNTGSGGGLDEIREHFINSAIGNNADNGNVKLVTRAAYPGQAKQVIASETGVTLIIDEVGPFDEPIAKVQPGPSSEKSHRSTVNDVAKGKTEVAQIEVSDFSSKIEITDVDLGPKEAREIAVKIQSNSLNSSELSLKEDHRSSIENIAKGKEASDLSSKEVIDVDIGLSEITMKIQSSQSNSCELASKESCKSIIESVVKEKIEVEQREILNLRSKREIVDANLSSNDDREIIVKVQPGPSNSNELVLKSARKLIIESTAKGKTEIGQKDVSGLRSKTEIADIDLGTNDDREIIMKIQPSQSSSSELRLGECCWPTRESTANDKVEVCDREINFEKEIIDIKLGLNEKSTLVPKERRKSTIGATNDETNSIKIEPEINPRFSQKREISISDKEVNIKKEIIDVIPDFTDNVVKVQPAHLSHSILTLKEDRRLIIEKLTNVEIKCNEEKIRSKENLELGKVDKNDTELTKVNVEVDNSGISSAKETANIELNKVEYLEAKAITSSLNRSMTSLDGRHECALSDFGVDKEDYRLSQYGSDEDEGEKKKPVLTTRLSLTKYADDHREDVIDNLADFINDNISNKKSDIQSYNGQLLTSAMIHKSHEDGLECFTTEEISKRAKSFEEVDQSKFIVEKALSEAEVNGKTNVENGKRIEEIIRILPETDKASRTEKGSEVNTHYSEWRMTSGDPNLEIDGKYLKSIVNLRKSPRKIREDQIRDVEIKEHQIVDDQQTLQSEVSQSSCTKTKSSEKINEEKTYKVDADIEKKDRIINNGETSSAEKVFQDSSRLTSMKMKSPTKVEELEVNEHEFKNRDTSINDREMSHLEKVFQNSSRSISTKIKSSRKVEELQTSENEQEFKDQDRSISNQEMPRSGKTAQKSSRISISAKSPKKVKKGQIPYKSEMKEYDRSINDRVISQLEEVFQDSLKKFSAKTESPKKGPENYIELKKQNRPTDNRETSRSEELSQHSSRTSSTKSPKKAQSQKTVKMNDNRGQGGNETTKTTKNTDNRIKHDLNEIKDVYTRKVRRYNVPLQGSLDSVIVSDELSAEKPKKDDAFSKKSKSYESIKRIQEVFLGVPSTKTNNSNSQLDIPDEFCSICCYMNDITFRTEEEVSSPNQETFYTLRSTCSSLADDDSIECDICGSLNLQESTDDLEGNIQDTPCEFCRICGEVDGNFDQDSTLSTGRYAFKVIEPHQEDDDSFEIENCGFQSGTESADDRSRVSEKEKIKDPGRPKSQSLFIHGSSMIRDQPRELYFIPKDEIAILTSGTRKVGRKGSLFRKKEDFNGSTRDNRRYSSVDSLQLAKMSSKASDKMLKVTKNQTLLGSADNLQISKDSKKSMSLKRSADDVGCLNLSTDNLDSLSESLGKENETEESTQKPNIRDKEAVKMILTQHGIKIISEKETAL